MTCAENTPIHRAQQGPTNTQIWPHCMKWEHFMQCCKPAWEHGFTVERNLKGWRLEGLIPFNRNALWRKHAANAKPLSLFRASSGHIAIAAALPTSSPALDSLSPTDRCSRRSIANTSSISPAYFRLRHGGYRVYQTQGQTTYNQRAPLLQRAYGCLSPAPRVLLGCRRVRRSKRREAAQCT